MNSVFNLFGHQKTHIRRACDSFSHEGGMHLVGSQNRQVRMLFFQYGDYYRLVFLCPSFTTRVMGKWQKAREEKRKHD